MNILAQKYIDRFWGKVDKEKSNTFYNGTRCWEWVAGTNGRGYGRIGFEMKSYLAHRISYQLAFGSFHKNMCVLHKCDNTFCVNPSHLFLGSQADNMKDMKEKGRGAKFPDRKGEKSPNHKLTDKQVDEIRKCYLEGDTTQVELSKKFGVDPSQIGHIVHYKQRI